MAKQLLGKGKNSRQFYSDGMFGRGTYLAVASDKKGASEEKTSEHCWKYGPNIGAVQLRITLNGNARIVRHRDLDKELSAKLFEKFPKLTRVINQGGTQFRKRDGNENLTMFAAFLGYNTIDCGPGNNEGTIDYFVTCDRKAITVEVGDARIRVEGKGYFNNGIDMVNL
jgi:hypothetical protein